MDLLRRSEDVSWMEEPVREVDGCRQAPEFVDGPAALSQSRVRLTTLTDKKY